MVGKVSFGKEESLPPEYYWFVTKESGAGYNKDFGDDKPVNVFASAGENWWEFWEWSVGIDVNVNGFGGSISVGPETSISVHLGYVSHEVGINALGRLYHKVTKEENGLYIYDKYSLNTPETATVVVGVVALAYFAGPAVASAGATLASVLAGSGILMPA